MKLRVLRVSVAETKVMLTMYLFIYDLRVAM